MDPTLEALWGQVVESWDDDTRHGAFLSYAQQTKQLGTAAGLYKSMIVEDSPYRISPNQLEDAQKRLAGVSMLAVMDLDNHKTDSTNARGVLAVRMIGLTIVLALFGALIWLLLHR